MDDQMINSSRDASGASMDSTVSASESAAAVRLKIFGLSEREARRWAPVISLWEQIKVDAPWREM